MKLIDTTVAVDQLRGLLRLVGGVRDAVAWVPPHSVVCTVGQLGGVPLEVGVRELRDHLRRWLDAVGEGDEVTVTDRGRPIARLIGVSGPSALERLIAKGVVTPARRARRLDRDHSRARASGTVSDLIAEQRR